MIVVKGEMNMESIGTKIKETRKLKGLNQEELAELARMHRVSIAKYETGRIEPGADALSRIADALEVTTDYLLNKTEGATIAPEREALILQQRLASDPALRELISRAVLATEAEKRAAIAMLKSLRESRTLTTDEPEHEA